MKRFGAIALAVVATWSSAAKAHFDPERYLDAVQEMQELVKPDTESRSVLVCITLATSLSMMDLRGMFVRKMEEFTQDGDALILAMTYMDGFVASETIPILNSDQAGELLGALFHGSCTHLILQ